MPRANRRTAREKALLEAYFQFRRAHIQRQLRRKRVVRQARNAEPCTQPNFDMDLDLSSFEFSSFTSASSGSDDFSNSSAESSDGWSDILGSDWRGLSDMSDTSGTGFSSMEFSVDDDMPSLDTVSDFSDSGSESGWDSDSDWAWDVYDGDDETSSVESAPETQCVGTAVRNAVMQEIRDMYTHRYEQPRDRSALPRPPGQLKHVLTTWKTTRPDHFREALRVNPATFDELTAKIENDPIFWNESNQPQASVDEQLAVALFRFGHDGNAASLQAVANWAGLGKGTVLLYTRRVMIAILRPSFMQDAVRMPTPDEKARAKRWVQKHSCKSWRNGWCFVDGTLIPLDERPTWYGPGYFDRKCNYSLNFQIVNLPNLQIIDFGYGHTGSAHDSHAWQTTRMALEHESLLEEGEWIWADSAYPIDTWITAPYKKPERDLPDNEVFNNHVSMLRIRSEHAIGFLKGRFHSLKHLRVRIMDAATHKLATYWVAACIGIHNFALRSEENKRGGEDPDSDDPDPFIGEGLVDDSASDDATDGRFVAPAVNSARPGARLENGKSF
ncbi:unnamed protein product [Mycena citricolor]|uniref:DDE Tnp4 domain-containing protein n=1 Tax=Mycena citricolor TaxID=2018698 RepID=A0AAD2HJ37_9AGAR|nr:unnamed protein product [Mycena citricolor]